MKKLQNYNYKIEIKIEFEGVNNKDEIEMSYWDNIETILSFIRSHNIKFIKKKLAKKTHAYHVYFTPIHQPKCIIYLYFVMINHNNSISKDVDCVVRSFTVNNKSVNGRIYAMFELRRIMDEIDKGNYSDLIKV